MIVIGITGILGSGKSTVSNMLEKEGLDIIDLDGLAKHVIERKEVLDDIRKAFGEEHITGNRVDIEKLRNTAFNNEESLRTLEKIIHPKAAEEMGKKIQRLREKGMRVVIIDGPLLFETGLYKTLDRVVVVSSHMEKIKERLKKRGMGEEDMKRRMPFQIPLEEKEKMADYVVYNNGTEEDLEKEVGDLMEKIKGWEVKVNAP
jgi:dephospho-CoA kinase